MKRLLIILLLLIALLLSACSADDPIPDDIYTKNIYPSENETYDLGSLVYVFKKGYFYSLEVLGEESLRIQGNCYSENITPIDSGNYSVGCENLPYHIGYFSKIILGGEEVSANATGNMTAHDIVGEYHIFPESPEGKVLSDNGTWIVVEGSLSEHGNEYHGPDFATEAALTSHTDNSSIHHEHGNKEILDNTQESFTSALKTAYDWLVTNITAAWKTSVDNFIVSKGDASGLAPLDASSKVPTVNLGGAGADATKYLRGDQTWAAPAGGGGASFVVSGASVYTGTSPTSWADLNLSGTVGTNNALVLLSFDATGDMNAIAVRMNGDTQDYFDLTNDASAYGMALGHHDSASAALVLMCVTDVNGVIEWRTETSSTATVRLIMYIK